MNCSARLLAVIALSCLLAGCNPGANGADEPQAQDDRATTLSDVELESVLNAPPPSVAESSAVNDASVIAATVTDVAATGVTATDVVTGETVSADADDLPIEPLLAAHPTSDAAANATVESTIDAADATEPVQTAEELQAESVTEAEPPAAGPSDGANERYTYSDDHDPNGIGKFYMGREIAMVMGHQGIAWLERPEREEEEGLSLLIECLDIEPGSTVADIGAGSGVLTLPFCDAVGEEGTVVAVDIQQEMLDALQLKAHEQGYRNVELVLGTIESPQLPEASVDLVVMVDVYHEFDHPYEMLLNISQSVRPGGRVVFVEYRKEDPDVLIKLVHKMTEEQVLLEASLPEFHLEHVETIHDLPVQHVVVFRKLDPNREQEPDRNATGADDSAADASDETP